MGPIVVLGMHRSGTSALAQALTHVGFAGPPDEFHLQGDEHNVHGYFEDSRMVETDDWLLDQHGGSYENPWPLRGVEPSPAELGRVADVWAAMEAGGTVVAKDPRLCVTLPWWVPAWGRDARFVIAVRHPSQVAASLASREAMPTVLAESLWWEYTVQALVGTAGRRRVLVRYDDLLADEVAVMRQVVDQLGLADAAQPPAGCWGGRVDRSLARQRVTVEPTLARVRDLWDRLQDVEDAVVPEFGPGAFEAGAEECALLRQALGAEFARGRLARIEAQHLRSHLEEAGLVSANQRLQLAAMEQSRSWRWTSALRRFNTVRTRRAP